MRTGEGGGPTTGPTIVTYAIGADGRYVEADPALLAATGYALEELRTLKVGGLSTSSPEAAEEAWARLRAGTFQTRQLPVLVRRKDGRLVDAIFLALEHDPASDRWLVRLELVHAPADRPTQKALAAVLDDWRSAERLLASLPDGDPMRDVVEAQVRELRERYAAVQASVRTVA